MAYSCPQFPHTNFPSVTCVSNSNVCRSLNIFSSLTTVSPEGSKGSKGPEGLEIGTVVKPSCCSPKCTPDDQPPTIKTSVVSVVFGLGGGTPRGGEGLGHNSSVGVCTSRVEYVTYLSSSDLQPLPIHTREDVRDECGVEIHLLLHEFGVFEVERVGGG